MFDAKTAAAVKLERSRKLSPAQEACGASCVWRRNCNISSFSAHTRQKSNRQKQPPEKGTNLLARLACLRGRRQGISLRAELIVCGLTSPLICSPLFRATLARSPIVSTEDDPARHSLHNSPGALSVFATRFQFGRMVAVWFVLASSTFMLPATAADLPPADKVQPVKLFEVDNYCEGVVFDADGRGYLSHGKVIVAFEVDGKHHVWAETGAPNGHKILADGTHLVCDASRHAVLHLAADGKLLANASEACAGKPLRGPNDLTLDSANDGFYFSDPGESSDVNPIGTVHYVDSRGTTHLCDGELAFPNGIVLTPDGKKLYLAESKKNRVLVYDVLAPGKIGNRQVFADLPTKNTALGQIDNQPDGMCLDADGNLYVAHYGMQQVQVLDPMGKLVRRYGGGNVTTSNVAFGGPRREQLFVTGGLGAEAGGGGLFRLDLGVPGLDILPKPTK
jgi:gluconolactonase